MTTLFTTLRVSCTSLDLYSSQLAITIAASLIAGPAKFLALSATARSRDL